MLCIEFFGSIYFFKSYSYLKKIKAIDFSITYKTYFENQLLMALDNFIICSLFFISSFYKILKLIEMKNT